MDNNEINKMMEEFNRTQSLEERLREQLWDFFQKTRGYSLLYKNLNPDFLLTDKEKRILEEESKVQEKEYQSVSELAVTLIKKIDEWQKDGSLYKMQSERIKEV